MSHNATSNSQKNLSIKPRLTTFLILVGVLMVSFQNFTEIPIHRLKPNFAAARALAASDQKQPQDGDIRKWAPQRPPGSQTEPRQSIATPDGGSDLNSVAHNWLEKQAHTITGGAEQRFLDSMNNKVQKFFDKKTSSAKNSSELEKNANAPQNASSANEATEQDGQRHPTSIRFSTLTRVEMGLSSSTNLSCAYDGSGLQWNLSRPISDRVDLNLRHKNADNSSSVHFNYSW